MATGMAARGEPIAAAPSTPAGLTAALLRRPSRGWVAIGASPASTAALYGGIAAPLAAIGPLARMIHALLFGSESMGIIQYRPTLGGAIVTAMVGWLLALLATWLLARAIEVSAPWFGGTRDRRTATKVAIFGSTAWWIASGFAAVPAIGFLQIVGLYSLVLLFIGAPLSMRVAGEKAPLHGFTVIGVAFALLIASLVAAGAVGRTSLRPTVKTASGREVVRDAPAIADSRLVAAETDKKAAVAPGIALAAAQGAVPPTSLQALLPERVGGFTRTALSSQSNLSAGAATADAKGTYVEGTNSFTLAITDAGQPGALATNNSIIAGEVNRVSDDGYQRSRVIDGVRINEKWSNSNHGGNYSRTVAGRFTVEAQGTAPAIDTLRAAVGAVDENRLTALAR